MPAEVRSKTFAALDTLVPDESVKAVVCGLKRDLVYMDYGYVHAHLSKPDVHFIATNDDTTLPLSGGRSTPGSQVAFFALSGVSIGAGAILSALVVSSGRQPVIVGKPHSPMLEALMSTHSIDPSRTCMVGDR